MTEPESMSREMAAVSSGTTYYRPQYEPAVPSVRGMPTGPRGGRGAMEAGDLLDLAALATIGGMTRSQVNALLDDFQEAALTAIVAAAPKFLHRNRMVTQARVREIKARVEALRRITLAMPVQTGWRGALGLAQPVLQVDSPEYVNLIDVVRIFDDVIAALASAE